MTEFHYYTLYNFRLPFHIPALIAVVEIKQVGPTCNHVYMGGQVKLQRPRYNLTQLHWYRYIIHPPYGIPRSRHNVTATNAGKVAAVVQRQKPSTDLSCCVSCMIVISVITAASAVMDLSSCCRRRHHLCCCSALLRPTVAGNGDYKRPVWMRL